MTTPIGNTTSPSIRRWIKNLSLIFLAMIFLGCLTAATLLTGLMILVSMFLNHG